MRDLSRRAGGKDDHVHRCTCGAWKYEGQECATCATKRGQEDGMDRNTDPRMPRL